jgi:acetate kinase
MVLKTNEEAMIAQHTQTIILKQNSPWKPKF